MGIAAVETKGTSNGCIDWIAADNNWIWENVLNNTAFLLIGMNCLMQFDFLELELCDIAVWKILRSVATFEFIELTPVQKSSLVCSSLCMFNFLEELKPHLYLFVPASTFQSPVQLSKSWDKGPSLPQETVVAHIITLFNTQILLMEAKFQAVSEAKDFAFIKSHAQA